MEAACVYLCGGSYVYALVWCKPRVCTCVVQATCMYLCGAIYVLCTCVVEATCMYLRVYACASWQWKQVDGKLNYLDVSANGQMWGCNS